MFLISLSVLAVILVALSSAPVAVAAAAPALSLHNDDFCDDLTTGGDENNTAACSGLSKEPTFFQCIGSKYLKQRVPSSRVGDGVCDCCDGSDESTSGAICEDNCAAQEAAEKDRI